MAEQRSSQEYRDGQERLSVVQRAEAALHAIEVHDGDNSIDAVTAELVADTNQELRVGVLRGEVAEEALLVGELSILEHHGAETPAQLAHSPEGVLAQTLVAIEQTKGVHQLEQLIEAIDSAVQQEKQDAATQEEEALVDRKQRAAEWIQEHTQTVDRKMNPLAPPRMVERFDLDTEKITEIPADLQKEIAHNILQREGGAYILNSILDRFSVLPNDVGVALIKKGYTTPLTYPDVFPDLHFTAKDAQSFIEAGNAYIPLSAAEKFDGFRPNDELAETLFANGDARTVLENLVKFDDFVLTDAHREQLIHQREYATLIDFAQVFHITPDETFAQQLIEDGAIAELGYAVQKFSGLSRKTVDVLIQEHALNNRMLFRSLEHFNLTEDDIFEIAIADPSIDGLAELDVSQQTKVLLAKIEGLGGDEKADINALYELTSQWHFRDLRFHQAVLDRMLEIHPRYAIQALTSSGEPFEQIEDLLFDKALFDHLVKKIPMEERTLVFSDTMLRKFPIEVRDGFVEELVQSNPLMYLRVYYEVLSQELVDKIELVQQQKYDNPEKVLEVLFREFPGSDIERALRSDDPSEFDKKINSFIRVFGVQRLYGMIYHLEGVDVPESLKALDAISSSVRPKDTDTVHDIMLTAFRQGNTGKFIEYREALKGVWSLKSVTEAEFEEMQHYVLSQNNHYRSTEFFRLVELLNAKQLPPSTRYAVELYGSNITSEKVHFVESILDGVDSDVLQELGIAVSGEAGLEALTVKAKGMRMAVLQDQLGDEILNTQLGIEIIGAQTRHQTAQWGSHGAESLKRLVETTKQVAERGGTSLLGPEYQPSEGVAIQTVDATKERTQWTEDAVSKYSSLFEELRAAQEVNRTPGGFSQLIRELSSSAAELSEQHKQTIRSGVDARGNALTEKGVFFLQKTVDELESVTGNLGSLRDFEKHFAVLAKHKSLHGPIRQAVFSWALRMNPGWEFTIESMQSEANLTDTTRQIEFVDHIVNQETFSTYFQDKQAASKFREIVNVKSLTDALERQSQLSTMSEKSTTLQYMPTRGLLMELSGHIGDACWASKYESIAETMPNMTAVIMKQHPGDPEKEKFVGSAMLIETIDEKTQEPTLVIRGLNPVENFINSVSPEGFFESFVSYARSIAEARGMKVGVVIDDHAGGSATNRPMLFGYLAAIESRLPKIPVPREGTTFNGYTITDKVYAV